MWTNHSSVHPSALKRRRRKEMPVFHDQIYSVIFHILRESLHAVSGFSHFIFWPLCDSEWVKSWTELKLVLKPTNSKRKHLIS